MTARTPTTNRADAQPASGARRLVRPPSGGLPPAPLAMPAAAALAVICASTAVSGVVGGQAWLVYVFVSTLVVSAAGVALRALRTPGALIWIGQLFVLLCLAVTLFTSSGLLVILPGPAALGDLGNVLNQSVVEVRTGVPPVTADAPILCLIVIALGAVAITVDNLAVTARVPATAGLILLCVYAVPASLDDGMLPWWSFVLGAASFTAMLAVDGAARHQAWRGKLGLPAATSSGMGPAATAITAVAAVLALFVGGTFTVIGTVGRLPGVGGNGPGGDGNLGINPVSSLQGLLNDRTNTELFDISGLPPDAPYLRAVTLTTYVPGRGFILDSTMPPGVPADGNLPVTEPAAAGRPTNVRINPVHWEDLWLPVFGSPQRLNGAPTDYRYNPGGGFVFTEHAQSPGPYVEAVNLAEPSQAQLRAAGPDYSSMDSKYLTAQMSQRVRQLAQSITANAYTEFDKAYAIWAYFRSSDSGFSYSTQTAPLQDSDPLVSFLFDSKTGFCEQYATAMAVLLRAVGVPVRVAIGFTDGYTSGDHRVITSQDAHAWDEVYFPNEGWFAFDPTPLGGGRSHTPAYLQNQSSGGGSTGGSSGSTRENQPNGSITPPTRTGQSGAPTGGGGAGPSLAPQSGGPSWQWWTVGALALLSALSTALTAGIRGVRGFRIEGALRRYYPVLARVAVIGWAVTVFFAAAMLSWWLAALVVVLGGAAVPSLVRESRRRRRERAVIVLGARAAGAAWAEVLAESWDRGTEIEESVTLRAAADRIVRDHRLDDEGQAGLSLLVSAVERSWYAPEHSDGTGGEIAGAFADIRRSMDRSAPLALRARLWPRSVLHPSRWWR